MRHILQPFYILCYDVFVNFHYRSRLLVLLRGYIISKVRRKHVEITPGSFCNLFSLLLISVCSCSSPWLFWYGCWFRDVFDREDLICTSILSSDADVNTTNFKFIGIIAPSLALVEIAAFSMLKEIFFEIRCLEIQTPKCHSLPITLRFLVLFRTFRAM